MNQQQEIYLWGTMYDPVVEAMKAAALIFSDGSYYLIASSVLIMGAVAVNYRDIMGMARGNVSTKSLLVTITLEWTLPGIIFLALVVPKTTVWIYSETKGAITQQGGIPVGMAFVMGTLNSVEQNVAKMIATANTSPSNYSTYDAITENNVFQMLYDVTFGIGLKVEDKNQSKNLASYIERCVINEMMMVNAGITAGSLKESNDFFGEFEKAANPSNYSLIYTDAEPNGKITTCDKSFVEISNYFASDAYGPGGIFNGSIKSMCAASGYKSDSTVEVDNCMDLFNKFLTSASGGSIGSDKLMKQIYATTTLIPMLENSTEMEGTEKLGLIEANKSMLGKAAVGHSEIGNYREIIYSILIGITPYLFLIMLFAPSTKKAVATYVFSFVFLSLWNLVDIGIQASSFTMAMNALEDIKNGQIGLENTWALPGSAFTAYNTMLSARWYSAGIAMIIAGAVGYSMSGVASSVSGAFSGHMSSLGSMAGSDATDVMANTGKSFSGLDNRFSNMAGAGQTIAALNVSGAAGVMATETAHGATHLIGGAKAVQSAGGVGGYVHKASEATRIDEMQRLSRAGQLTVDDATKMGRNEGVMGAEQAKMDLKLSNALANGDLGKLHAQRAGAGVSIAGSHKVNGIGVEGQQTINSDRYGGILNRQLDGAIDSQGLQSLAQQIEERSPNAAKGLYAMAASGQVANASINMSGTGEILSYRVNQGGTTIYDDQYEMNIGQYTRQGSMAAAIGNANSPLWDMYATQVEGEGMAGKMNYIQSFTGLADSLQTSHSSSTDSSNVTAVGALTAGAQAGVKILGSGLTVGGDTSSSMSYGNGQAITTDNNLNSYMAHAIYESAEKINDPSRRAEFIAESTQNYMGVVEEGLRESEKGLSPEQTLKNFRANTADVYSRMGSEIKDIMAEQAVDTGQDVSQVMKETSDYWAEKRDGAFEMIDGALGFINK